MGVLAYYAVKKGLDIVLGIAMILNAVSMVLNIYCEVNHGRKKD